MVNEYLKSEEYCTTKFDNDSCESGMSKDEDCSDSLKRQTESCIDAIALNSPI